MRRGTPTKETFIDWLNTLISSKGDVHHLGEYYSYLTGKEFHNKQGTARKLAIEWLEKYYYKEIAVDFFSFSEHLTEWCDINEYDLSMYTDWRGQGFLFVCRDFSGGEV